MGLWATSFGVSPPRPSCIRGGGHLHNAQDTGHHHRSPEGLHVRLRLRHHDKIRD